MKIETASLKQARVKATVVFTDEERKSAETGALTRLASHVEIKGFRVGKAPPDKVRERMGEEAVLEETVRGLLPAALKEALASSEAKPILRPSVEIVSKEPLTIAITFVNRPTVTVKKPEKISVKKNTVAEVTDADVSDFIKKVLLQDRTEKPVEREARTGDSVRFSLDAKKGKEVLKELTVPGYGMILGSEELLPELEIHVTGMKSGETKSVNVTFPKDHDIPAVRGEKIALQIALKTVSEVTVPELTQEYITTRLKVEKTPEALKAEVREMLADRKKNEEMRRREEELYDTVRKATSVDIAPELVEAEVQEMVRDLHERLERQGTNVTDWLKATGKTEKDVVDEMRSIASSRLVLRFGMQELAEVLKIEPDPVSFDAALKAAEAQAKASNASTKPGDFVSGGTVYENLRYELRMEALKDKLIADEA